jgi:hypothetical protein
LPDDHPGEPGDRCSESTEIGAALIAIKEVVAWQIEQAMLKGNITKAEMAKRDA